MQPILFDYSLHVPACHAHPLVMLEASAVQAPCFPTGFPRERRLVQTGNLIWSACRSTTALGRLGLPPNTSGQRTLPKAAAELHALQRRFPDSSAVPLRGYDFRRRKAKKAVASDMAGERLEGKTNGYLEWLTPHLNGY
jgi:hypothetical protein